MKALTMNDVDMKGKRVVMRVDVNVPIHDGVITSDKRIRAVLPTIKKALDAGAEYAGLEEYVEKLSKNAL